jgi:hypothetical protein
LKKKLQAIAGRAGLTTPLEWVVSEVASGVTITQLAKDVSGMDLPGHPEEEMSRNWFSMVVNKLPVPPGAPSAKEQIAAARREAAYVLLDHAIQIADEPANDSASVQRNRLRSDVRLRTAALWNREELGDRSAVTMKLNIGALHIEAMRARTLQTRAAIPQLEAGALDFEIDRDDATAPPDVAELAGEPDFEVESDGAAK